MSLLRLHSRSFWIVFLTLALVAALGAFKLLAEHVPLLKVDIKFSRAEAVAAAARFQQQQYPELKTTRVASQFMSDRAMQNYIDLEAGGLEAYKTITNNIDAMTHYWKVRNFSEAQEKELTVVFSPRGELASYWLTVPEKEPGAALDEAAARVLAEQGAHALMGDRFNNYKPFEFTQKRQVNGRVDYTFSYEHTSLKLGEARFRIKVYLAGDKLAGVDTFNFIPEAFNQRFNEMRSLNNQISQFANYLMLGLFGLGGLVGGGIWLHRRNQLQWKRGLLPAGFVSLGLAAATVCSLPMAWMSYNTTVAAKDFLLQQLAGAGVVLVACTLVFATIYSVAEGLSRVAFADHPRLFDFFKTPVASSPEATGRVLGAYGWMGFFLLYAMVFVVFTSKVLGWWQPTDVESDPNILASWRPALGPIFTALQAGTWEECLFRAIPLSIAAIIGRHFGIRGPLVIFALVAQALIFGGAHANYPNMPGYSRLVELFIPAMAFGLVYLRFGLVVGMLTHFLYDLVLMSLPIFTVQDSSLIIDKVLVVLVGIAPLLILLWARWRAGSSQPLANEWRNGEVVLAAPEPESTIPEAPVADAPQAGPRPLVLGLKVLIPLVLVSLVLILVDYRKPADVQWPRYSIDRSQAKAAAEAVLAKRGVELKGEWRQTIVTYTGSNQAADFVWRESDKATFQRLVGTYIDTGYWTVSWRKFDGPVEQRSERWEAWLYPDGSLHELVHVLPEAQAGAKLTREQATAKALSWIVAEGWGDANKLEEKSVEETVRPARSDWTLKYIDKAAFNHKNGQAMIRISLSGDEVTGFVRTIDVPDEWARAEASRQSSKTPYRIAGPVAIIFLMGLALSSFLGKSAGGKIRFGISLPWMSVNLLAFIGVSVLWMDGATSAFQPTMGWNQQLGMMAGGIALMAAVLAVVTLFAAQAVYAQRPLAGANVSADFVQGTVLAVALAALAALAHLLLPGNATPQPYAADVSTYAPWFTTILNGFKGFMRPLILLVFAVGLLRFIKTPLRLSLAIAAAAVFVLAQVLSAVEFAPALANQLVATLGIVLMLDLVRRQQVGIAIAFFGVGVVLNQLSVTRALYDGATLHGILSAICALAVTYGLLFHWHKKN